MNITEEMYNIPVDLEHNLNMSYAQLNECQMDFDFSSVIQDGKDFHQLKKPLCISYQQFHDRKLTNLFFAGNQPIRLELSDSSLTSYYSDYIELRYIISGNLTVEIEGEIAHFVKDEICFINSMAYHKESIQESDCMLVNISVQRDVFNEVFLNNVSISPLQQFLRKNIMKHSDEKHYLKFTPLNKDHLNTIQTLLFTIVSEIRYKKPGYIDISKGYLLRLMDELSTGFQHNFSKSDNDIYVENLFKSVDEYMKNNLSTIKMEQLTKEFYFQPNYFNNLIKKQTGKTYSEYLIYLRIEKAKTLLTSSNLNIEEIMWLVGYHNKGFFYKKFEELTKMSPSKYRSTLSNL